MMTAWAFIFLSILCLMFLAMLYGEQLSAFRFLEGRWFEPLGAFVHRVWSQLGLAVDLFTGFVWEHFSWVVAAASGTVGLFIVAFLMFSGMADDAAATYRDLHVPLLAGGVIDRVPEIRTQSAGQVMPSLLVESMVAQTDDSEYLWQQPGGGYYVFLRPELDRPRPGRTRRPEIEVLPDLDPAAESRSLDRPVMELTLRRGETRSLQIEDDTETITRGRLIEWPLPQQIERAVRSLPLDDWRMTVASRDLRDRFGNIIDSRSELMPGRELQESPAYELEELESRVRIIPGDSVSAQQLRVEKTAPRESGGSEVTLDIRVLNLGATNVQGLVIREFLPRNTRVRQTEPAAIYRDDTLTWLIEELQPFDEQLLQLTVVVPAVRGTATRRPRFESATEVSAVAAVRSRVLVRSDAGRRELPRETPYPERDLLTPSDVQPSRPVPRPGLDPPATERELPLMPIARRPDVRLRIEEPLLPVEVGQTVEVNFVVQNRGDAVAEGVGLRVVLGNGLRHHRVAEDELNREVVNQVRQLEPGETRSIVLRMRATRKGEFLSRAEMIFQGESLSRDTFRVVAQDRAPADPFGPALQ